MDEDSQVTQSAQTTSVEQPPITPTEQTPPINQPQIVKQSKNKKFIVFWSIIIILSVIVVGYYVNSFINLTTSAKKDDAYAKLKLQQETKKFQQTPTPNATANWKTYTNNTYHFTFQYPAKGTISTTNGPQGVGDCGNAIKDARNFSSTDLADIWIDNFFSISVIPWQDTLESYIKKYDPQSINIYTSLPNAKADAAVKISGINPNAPHQDIPPFRGTIAMYKANNKLFILSNSQNPGNFGGCAGSDNSPALNAQYSSWDVTNSFKFID